MITLELKTFWGTKVINNLYINLNAPINVHRYLQLGRPTLMFWQPQYMIDFGLYCISSHAVALGLNKQSYRFLW